MITVNYTEYYCDYCKYEHSTTFGTIDGFMDWLADKYLNHQPQEWRKSFYVKGMCMRLRNILSARSGYYGSIFVRYIKADGVIIFEESRYCSPNLTKYLEEHPFKNLVTKTYGDVAL